MVKENERDENDKGDECECTTYIKMFYIWTDREKNEEKELQMMKESNSTENKMMV